MRLWPFLRFVGTAMIVMIVSNSASAFPNFAKKKPKSIEIEYAQEKPILGEQLIYDVRWFGIPIGFGEIRIEKGNMASGREVYVITVVSKSNSFCRGFTPYQMN